MTLSACVATTICAAAPEQSVAAPAKDAAASAFLADCISHTARMLNSLFADASTAREFVDRGGEKALRVSDSGSRAIEPEGQKLTDA